MRTVVVLTAACLPVLGCAFLKSASGQWGGGSAVHSGGTQEGRTEYGVVHLTRNSRVYLVMISEGGSGPSSSGSWARGTFKAPDGREVAWGCETSDGRSGRVTIGSESFDLAQGAVFLVNLRDGKTAVEQLTVDIEQFQPNGQIMDQLKVVAQSNERLAAFIKLCETPK